jgi:hypothetical protein
MLFDYFICHAAFGAPHFAGPPAPHSPHLPSPLHSSRKMVSLHACRDLFIIMPYFNTPHKH